MHASSEIMISASAGSYPVRIGTGSFGGLLQSRPGDSVVADAFFADALIEDRHRTLFLEVSEGNKTLGSAETLIAALRDLGVGRGDRLIAVGGGIVQDVATLVASLYMRGLSWTYVPTTLLAMADSCIGGKSSLNVGPYKNLAGNFHPPELVIIDPAFISTLSKEDRVAGLCEAMKISFCRGPQAFSTYLDLVARFTRDEDAAAALLAHVLDCKRWFIEVDEFDMAERRQLNFGHTFGHALEAATGFRVSHGVAVGIGVIAAECLCVALDGDAAGNADLRAHAVALVRSVPDLGPRLAVVDDDLFFRAFLMDKKHGSDGLHVVVPAAGGGTEERVLTPGDTSTHMIRSALGAAIEEVTA